VLSHKTPLQGQLQLGPLGSALAHGPARPMLWDSARPSMSASIMARPLLPSTSVATEESLMLAPSKSISHPVDFPRPCLHQGFAVSGELAPFPDGLGRNKAGREQPMAQEVRQPLGSLSRPSCAKATALMCCGLTRRMVRPSSSRLNTGLQYTPVLVVRNHIHL
jgi:hypothetical protein